ncbi:hypothetical protein SOVF_202370 [Spinacia oleracea]|uniref:Uncharacterized protein n=1 Tax=Spinacia oleracea TaxID=3562 RepID=A0ABM3R687_SPIOL|nr:uncharacterized protein LOC130466298 [Spinacia oleracea]XP_056691128.1 uncharacterized protein LOC130466298 [Spinacia oleracea]XP_056691130.1 uncharacterized protein LOC130466298 [Spinacia oleracea]KNA04148.1 hypothetical protein SOVF_202370 [Spinacia oleracea]
MVSPLWPESQSSSPSMQPDSTLSPRISPPSPPYSAFLQPPWQTPSNTQSPSWTPPSPPHPMLMEYMSILETEIPAAGISEMNFNKVDYLLDTTDINNLQIASSQTLREMIMNLDKAPVQWLDLKMLTPGGDLLPAHLSNFSDLEFLPPATRRYCAWRMDKLALTNSSDIIPLELEYLMDPPPQIPKSGKSSTYIRSLSCSKLGVGQISEINSVLR